MSCIYILWIRQLTCYIRSVRGSLLPSANPFSIWWLSVLVSGQFFDERVKVAIYNFSSRGDRHDGSFHLDVQRYRVALGLTVWVSQERWWRRCQEFSLCSENTGWRDGRRGARDYRAGRLYDCGVSPGRLGVGSGGDRFYGPGRLPVYCTWHCGCFAAVGFSMLSVGNEFFSDADLFSFGRAFPSRHAPPVLEAIAIFDPLAYGVDGLRAAFLASSHFGLVIDFGRSRSPLSCSWRWVVISFIGSSCSKKRVGRLRSAASIDHDRIEPSVENRLPSGTIPLEPNEKSVLALCQNGPCNLAHC